MAIVGTPKSKLIGRPKGSVSKSGKASPLRIARDARLSQTTKLHKRP